MGSLSKRLICVVSFAVLTACAGTSRVPKTQETQTKPEMRRGESTPDLISRAGLLQVRDTGGANDALRAGLASENAQRRKMAVRALGFVRDGSMSDGLIAAFDDADASVRAEAILTAGLQGAAGTVPAIIQHRADSDTSVRSAVAVALGLLAKSEAIAPLAELLADESRDVRLAACYTAARMTGADDLVETLLEMVKDPDTDISAAALYAVSRLSGRLEALGFAARFKVREELVRLSQSRNPGILMLVAEGLYSPLVGEQADTLHAMLRSDHPEILLAILRSTSIPGAPAFVFHELLIKHQDERVVLGTILGLRRMRGDSVSAVLLDFILNDSRDWLRADAIRSLSLADPRLLMQIANGLSKDPRPILRAATAEALYGNESPEAAEYARLLFGDGEAWVRIHAIPAMAAVDEPLTSVFSELLKKPFGEARIRMAQAAGYRLAMTSRSEADHADAIKLLARLWKQASAKGSLEIQLAVIQAAAESGREDGALLVRKALNADDLGVRQRAVALLESHFDEHATLDAPRARPMSYYEEIAIWAAQPRAAVVTVARQGFVPGRFTIVLDTENSPLASWHFSRLANEGFYDTRRIDPFLPALRLHSGRGSDDRYASSSWSAEPAFSLFGPGTVASAGDQGLLMGEWLITLGARPNYLGRFSPFGRVVQNLAGVVGNILPIDRIVQVRAYEGNGHETLPPLR
jgi:HEAT repeat protein